MNVDSELEKQPRGLLFLKRTTMTWGRLLCSSPSPTGTWPALRSCWQPEPEPTWTLCDASWLLCAQRGRRGMLCTFHLFYNPGFGAEVTFCGQVRSGAAAADLRGGCQLLFSCHLQHGVPHGPPVLPQGPRHVTTAAQQWIPSSQAR